MLQPRKVTVLSSIALLVVLIGLLWFSPLHPGGAHSRAPAAPAALKPRLTPNNPIANGPYTVQGNTILGADRQPYIFHGIGRDSLEYDCAGDGHFTPQELAYMGSGTNTATATYWGANTVRLPLSEGIWLKGMYANAFTQACSASQYQALIKQTVDNLTVLKLNVIIDLQWADAGGQFQQGGGPTAEPDADSVTFWQQVATIYKGYSNVLFEIFNEPHPFQWSCWAAPCPITNDNIYSDDCRCTKTVTYNSVGLQALVNAVRGTGATNLVLVAGMNWGFDLSQIAQYPITGTNIVYDTHPYPYNDKMPSTWDTAFGQISATYPVMSAESGEYDCGTSYMNQLLSYFDAHNIGWISWAWVVSGGNNACTYPQLIQDYQGTPLSSMGQFIYQRLHSYNLSSPVSKTWYFAEGRVGGNFKEFLTLSNPDPTNPCSVNVQYLEENGSIVTKTVTVNSASRVTQSANTDLNIQTTQSPGVSVSAVVTVNTNTTPSCAGIVAERPMYFNWHGITSGSDVVGSTQTGTMFNFADVSVGGGFSSFLTVLNPGKTAAIVTAMYYANGAQYTQILAVPAGTRGTIMPGNVTPALPQHVAAVVTSDQPIVVERPDYFSNINAGNAGTVFGASCIVGARQLADDWLFAEGYTGGRFQETLVIANLDTTTNATANVTINLGYQNGTMHSYSVSVPTKSQLIWDVNTRATGAPTFEVSAEVRSTGAQIIVERQMYFQYLHTINGKQTTAIGGTDVIGQVGPAPRSGYNFAEGYTNSGYNEWLTLQNPTSIPETVNLTLLNGYGRSYTQAVSIGANSRSTMDITALVQQKLVRAGDNYHAYEVSMMVQASNGTVFVAERPMYWNTGSWTGSSTGTQGGSDVFGFTS